MGKTKQVEPRHVALRLFPDSRAIVNKLMAQSGRDDLGEAYILIVPNAQFMCYRYPLGLTASVRVVGEGTSPHRNRRILRQLPASIICAGHVELAKRVREYSVEENRWNRRQLRGEKDSSFLDRATRSPLKTVVGWDDINQMDSTQLNQCRSDLRVLKAPRLYGEVCWIPRRNWESGDLDDGILTPLWSDRKGCFQVPDYPVPSEVQNRGIPAGGLPPLPTGSASVIHKGYYSGGRGTPHALGEEQAAELDGVFQNLLLGISTGCRHASRRHIAEELRDQYALMIDHKRLSICPSDPRGWPQGNHEIAVSLHPNWVTTRLKVRIAYRTA
jgi:hypothetical protein